jgi:hypothetical protein
MSSLFRYRIQLVEASARNVTHWIKSKGSVSAPRQSQFNRNPNPKISGRKHLSDPRKYERWFLRAVSTPLRSHLFLTLQFWGTPGSK